MRSVEAAAGRPQDMGALVTGSGGVLSHPAIIARENGIPVVVGTKTGTTSFRDGDTGTVHHAQVG